jgi:hypothetical protein
MPMCRRWSLGKGNRDSTFLQNNGGYVQVHIGVTSRKTATDIYTHYNLKFHKRQCSCRSFKRLFSKRFPRQNFICILVSMFDSVYCPKLFIIMSMKWDYFSKLWPPTGLFFVPYKPRWYRNVDRSGGMILTEGNRRTRSKTCLSATLSTTTATWTEVRGWRPTGTKLNLSIQWLLRFKHTAHNMSQLQEETKICNAYRLNTVQYIEHSKISLYVPSVDRRQFSVLSH